MTEQNEFTLGNGRSMADNYYNWPREGIHQPQENDVMCGRGGRAQHHPGNIRYREMVGNRTSDYVNSSDNQKEKVSEEIVREWRAQMPPGRFLEFNEITGLWNDVGDRKTQKKTSQALRDLRHEVRTPEIPTGLGFPAGFCTEAHDGRRTEKQRGQFLLR